MGFVGRKPTNAPLTSDDIPNGIISAADLASGISGLITWQSVQTTGFTAVAARAYPCNTTSAAFTVTLPASPNVGDQILLLDYAGTFDTNALTINPNSNKLEGGTSSLRLTGEREGVTLTYIDSTQGWLASSGINEGTDALSPVPYSIDFLVVAGGGSGANGNGAGGGAGGYRTSTQSSLALGNDGSNSSISGSGLTTITSTGGGGGATGTAGSPTTGKNGGSGGGAAYANTTGFGSGNTPSTSPSQGNNGGQAYSTSPSYGSGGGGGASAVGGNGTSSTAGNGGNGTASSITGSSVTRAGGGGGCNNSGPHGSGGLGGGGAGGKAPATTATAGTANTGGGGGGGDVPSGGAGGKGIVILSIPTANYSGTITGSPTESTSGSNKILEFTGSGSYTA